MNIFKTSHKTFIHETSDFFIANKVSKKAVKLL